LQTIINLVIITEFIINYLKTKLDYGKDTQAPIEMKETAFQNQTLVSNMIQNENITRSN